MNTEEIARRAADEVRLDPHVRDRHDELREALAKLAGTGTSSP